MAQQNAEQDLCATTYSDNDDFPTFISMLRNKWAQANALGAAIFDKNFKTIVINSLPRSWNLIIASLSKDMPSSEAIS